MIPAMPSKLPRNIRTLFWEYDSARLTWAADRDLIIGRILAVGNWDSLRWLRRRLSDAELRLWLEQRRGAEQSAIAILGTHSRLAASSSQCVARPTRTPGLGGPKPRMTWHPEILAQRRTSATR
jgi:hypothetical protein